jgi:ankyrin repeat protein
MSSLQGYAPIVEALCQANAQIEIHNGEGCCALIRAANYGNEECLKLLLEYGANVNIVSLGGGNSALIKAAEKGHYGIAKVRRRSLSITRVLYVLIPNRYGAHLKGFDREGLQA